MKFGDYIRQKREEHGLTQPEAAAKIEIEQSYLSKLETGKSYPSEDIFIRLCKTYGIKPEELVRSVFSAELDKLREIKEVRKVVLSRQKSEARLMRGWLIAGLLMIMIGAGMLGLAVSIPEDRSVNFRYQSAGVIKEGESPMIFEMLYGGAPDKDGKTWTDRANYDYRTVYENRGDFFMEKVEGGYRKYTLLEAKERHQPTAISWHYALGTMFLFGGLACFYVSRRWQ
ncbi:MAG: helix-turn-helix transcriptional regulator [Alphaproteobacteria bacterium]|nr:helix-turn-helix transcriptional regulator [Alphaproteobacteria bacterium]